MLHLIYRVKMHEQLVAELAATAVVVLRIHNQCFDTVLVHLGEHVVKELSEGIVLCVHALVELQIADALVRE